MEDSYEQEESTETSALIGQPSAPPACDEPPAVQPPPTRDVQPPFAQSAPQIVGQYPQVQVGGVSAQTWPQGYPVSSSQSVIRSGLQGVRFP